MEPVKIPIEDVIEKNSSLFRFQYSELTSYLKLKQLHYLDIAPNKRFNSDRENDAIFHFYPGINDADLIDAARKQETCLNSRTGTVSGTVVKIKKKGLEKQPLIL